MVRSLRGDCNNTTAKENLNTATTFVAETVSADGGSTGMHLLIIFIAIMANAFFAASEIAVISLNDAKVKRDAEHGGKIDKILYRFVTEPTKFLATIQVGITLVGFLTSAFAAVTLADPLASFFSKIGITDKIPPHVTKYIMTILVTVALSFFTLIFGELVPKRLAMKNSDRLSRMAAVPLHWMAVIAKPFVCLLNFSTNSVLRMLGIDPEDKSDRVSEEEIRMMVDIGGENGTIEADEKEMIENVFEFNNTVASEIMVHRKDIVAIASDSTEDECREIMRQCSYSRIPVYEGTIDNIKGILNTRDFLLRTMDNTHVDFMQILRKPLFVPETIRADILFSQMQKNKISMAIVLDEYGGTSGLITLEDLLEEIVGEIYDEYDKPEDAEKIVKLSDGKYRVPGDMDLESVADELKFQMPEDEDFNTFGGIVFDRMKTVPSVGSSVELPKLRVTATIEKMDGNRIASVIVEKMPEPEQSEDEEKKEEEADD